MVNRPVPVVQPGKAQAQAATLFGKSLSNSPAKLFALISEAASITDGERGRKVAMGVGLGTQSVGLGLKDPYRVRPGREAHRGRVALGEGHERSGELRRIAALFAVHS